MQNTVSGLMSPAQAQALKNAITKAAKDPDYLSSVSGGGPVEQFEEAFAQAVGAKYALALSSCTAAIHVALMTYGIGQGDEVIVSPYTWGQSVSPVLFTGATPVFADIDPDTCTLDPKSIEERISKRTKAIIPVHIFGIPADMDTICSIAKKNGIAVISDAAQAFGALSKGRKLGGLGDVACYSLGRGKAVCGGEGGVLITNNQHLYEKAIIISQHPLRVFMEIFDNNDFIHDELNWNYRVHSFATIAALADLKQVEKRLKCRKKVFSIIEREIVAVEGLKILDHYPGDEPSIYGIPLTFTMNTNSEYSREMILESFRGKGINIEIGPIKTPIHRRPTFQNRQKSSFKILTHRSHKKGSCPAAEFRCENLELFINTMPTYFQ